MRSSGEGALIHHKARFIHQVQLYFASFLAQQAAEQGLPIGDQAVKQFATLKPSQQAAA